MKDVFANPLTNAVERLDLPAFNFAAILKRAATNTSASQRKRRIVWLTVGFLIPAIAAAAVLRFVPFQVTHRFGNWQVYGPPGTSTQYRYPAQKALAEAAQLAPYRVVWPVGMPKSSVLEYLDSEASQMFVLFYPCPGSLTGYSSVGIIPKNFSAINPNLGKWFDSQTIPRGKMLKFAVGEERMLLESTCLSNAEMQHVRTATLASGTAP